jgi:hypothetical protein
MLAVMVESKRSCEGADRNENGRSVNCARLDWKLWLLLFAGLFRFHDHIT